MQSLFFLQSSIHHPIDTPVALSFLCVLVDISSTLYKHELSAVPAGVINPQLFFDGTFEYQHFDRVGGVLSYLRKAHRSDINHVLGPERASLVNDVERSVIRPEVIGEL